MWLLMGALRGILIGFTKSTDHPGGESQLQPGFTTRPKLTLAPKVSQRACLVTFLWPGVNQLFLPTSGIDSCRMRNLGHRSIRNDLSKLPRVLASLLRVFPKL